MHQKPGTLAMQTPCETKPINVGGKALVGVQLLKQRRGGRIPTVGHMGAADRLDALADCAYVGVPPSRSWGRVLIAPDAQGASRGLRLPEICLVWPPALPVIDLPDVQAGGAEDGREMFR